MHASTEQLLELRDGLPVDSAVVQHVDLCESCSVELKQLRERRQALMDLPQLQPSPQAFAQLSERLAMEQARPKTQPLRWAAAAVLMAALALWMVPRHIETPVNEQATLPDDAVAFPVADASGGSVPQSASAAPESNAGRVADTAALRDELLRRSSALEAVSAQLANMGQATSSSSSTNDALNALETQLALVDYNLNAAQIDQYIPDELNALLARRVNTLENIVSVRQAELARQGYHGFQVMTASTIEEDQTW